MRTLRAGAEAKILRLTMVVKSARKGNGKALPLGLFAGRITLNVLAWAVIIARTVAGFLRPA
jgi:hypothetical protein